LILTKTAIITGASRGIGRAAAKLFACKGFNVVLNYMNSEEQIDALTAEMRTAGNSFIKFKADVSDSAQVKEMIDETVSVFGNIDVLVNNAGIAGQSLFCDITEEAWQRMFDVNVTGTFNCCRYALPYMLKRKKGKIINISSIWGITGASCEVHYSASKAAVIGLTKALAKELAPSGIQVNCVAPGIIETDMNSSLTEEDKEMLINNSPMIRLGTPSDIANAVYFLAGEESDYITGQVLSPNGGFLV
jgi:3-oxoacyl-[acyl-carrier protein] reductase